MREALGGHPVPRDNLHLTLCFLGEVAADAEQEARDRAAAVGCVPLTVVLGALAWWPGPRVLVAVPSAAAAEVSAGATAALARDICPHIKSFRAHVTLAREVGPPRMAHQAMTGDAPSWPLGPVQWHCDRFVLVESRRGAPYSIVGEWPLYSR